MKKGIINEEKINSPIYILGIVIVVLIASLIAVISLNINYKDKLIIERDYYKSAFLGVCDTMNGESNLINLIERHTPSDENYLEQLDCERYILK